MVKDEEEIKHMKVSSEINDKTMEKVIKVVPEMLSERLLAKAVKIFLKGKEQTTSLLSR